MSRKCQDAVQRFLEAGSRTTRELIWKILSESSYPHTASDLAKLTGRRLDSVSSLLKKMVDDGALVRFKGIGPRGGSGFGLRCLS